MDKRFSLVLVHTEGWQAIEDFEKIKAFVEALATDIEVFLVSNLSRSPTSRKKAARHPTLVFSPIKLLEFRPDRGKIYQGVAMPKLDELDRLKAYGLPIPAYEPLLPNTLLKRETYGDWVVLKPAHELASWGEGIELSRLNDVKSIDYQSDQEQSGARNIGFYVQRYVDCGRAMTCRVLTLFGEPIFTFVRTSRDELKLDKLQTPYRQKDFMPVDTDLVFEQTNHEDIFELARMAFKALPEIALQACDILRDKLGNLHLLEVNPGGGTWMFSNKFSSAYRKSLNVDDLAGQFNAFEKCAQLLIERTRMEAF
ncbi:hypothetical protein M8994_16560 [Brucella sp. 21LCYQ03]|nr:hypothetical protein [Brucella sp. 21LCYQ03]